MERRLPRDPVGFGREPVEPGRPEVTARPRPAPAIVVSRQLPSGHDLRGRAGATGPADPVDLSVPRRSPSPATRRRVESGVGTLSTAAVARMEERLPWYRALSAEDRSWVGLVAQAGIGAFVAWFREPDAPLQVPPDVFGTAPRELVRSVSLGATLEMVRTVIEIVEEQVDRPRRAGRRGRAARGRAALLPRGRLRRGPRLRRGRRVARRLGCPAGVAGARCRAARRGRRVAALPRHRPGLGRDRPGGRHRGADPACARSGGRATRSAAAPDTADASCSPPSRATGWWRSSARSPTPWPMRPRSPSGSAPDRSSSDPPSPTCTPRAARPGPRSPAWSRSGPGPRRPDRCWPTTCCPNASSPATGRPGGPWSTGSTARSSTPAAPARHGHGVRRVGQRPGVHGPHPVRPPEHGSLPIAPDHRDHRIRRDRPSRGLRPADRAGPRTARLLAATSGPTGVVLSRSARSAFVGNLYILRPEFVRVPHRFPTPRPEGWPCARHRLSWPGLADPRLPRPVAGAARLPGPADLAVGRRRHRPGHPRHRRPTPTPSGTPPSPSR